MKSIDELAIEYVMLRHDRPARPFKWQDRTPPSQETINHFHDYVENEHNLYEEMCGRVGIDNTLKALEQAQYILTMMGVVEEKIIDFDRRPSCPIRSDI